MKYIDGKIHIFKGATLKTGARLVLKNKLHNMYGVIAVDSRMIIMGHQKNMKLATFWMNGRPVAIVTQNRNTFMAYCKPYYRRRGYATECLSALKFKGKAIAYTTKCSRFWEKQKTKFDILNNDWS